VLSQRGAYRALPLRRVYIPKPGGRQRPLAVAALEDKIVQRAVVALLNAIYEEDFLGISYGFRPGRGTHDALDALCVGIHSRKVSFILDADIQSFFDTVNQEWLIRFVEHRIGDRRIIRLIRKWLKTGVMEDGVVTVSDRGTGQGAVISPLLANIYLHYALDLWAVRWRQREATGDMIIVRYADDFIVGFQHESDARRFLDEMRERLLKFALTLHPEKTRLIEFGRFAAERRQRRGLGKPETFNSIHGLGDLGAIRASSRDLLAEYLLAAGGLELIELPVELLISGPDPGIAVDRHDFPQTIDFPMSRTGGEQPPLRPKSIEECEGSRTAVQTCPAPRLLGNCVFPATRSRNRQQAGSRLPIRYFSQVDLAMTRTMTGGFA
jgi:hypothetical protein